MAVASVVDKTATRITPANAGDLECYIDLLEETGEWLNGRGFGQLPSGTYRECTDYFSLSIARGEVYLGFRGDDSDGNIYVTTWDGRVFAFGFKR